MNGFVRPPLPHMPVVQVGHRAGAGPGPPVLYTHPTASAPSRPFIHNPRGGSSTMVPSKNPVGRRGRAVAGGEERELAGLYLRRARAELDELASAGFMLAGNGFPQVLMLKGEPGPAEQSGAGLTSPGLSRPSTPSLSLPLTMRRRRLSPGHGSFLRRLSRGRSPASADGGSWPSGALRRLCQTPRQSSLPGPASNRSPRSAPPCRGPSEACRPRMSHIYNCIESKRARLQRLGWKRALEARRAVYACKTGGRFLFTRRRSRCR